MQPPVNLCTAFTLRCIHYIMLSIVPSVRSELNMLCDEYSCVVIGWSSEAYAATWSADTGSQGKAEGPPHHILHHVVQPGQGDLDHLQRKQHQPDQSMSSTVVHAYWISDTLPFHSNNLDIVSFRVLDFFRILEAEPVIQDTYDHWQNMLCVFMWKWKDPLLLQKSYFTSKHT